MFGSYPVCSSRGGGHLYSAWRGTVAQIKRLGCEGIMRKLMTLTGASAVAAVTIVLASGITARAAADEPKKLAPADVPQKVMDAVKARLPGVQVTSVEKETENG